MAGRTTLTDSATQLERAKSRCQGAGGVGEAQPGRREQPCLEILDGRGCARPKQRPRFAFLPFLNGSVTLDPGDVHVV